MCLCSLLLNIVTDPTEVLVASQRSLPPVSSAAFRTFHNSLNIVEGF
jgi:hypothetical protein